MVRRELDMKNQSKSGLQGFDFGARQFFDGLTKLGGARITAAAWTCSILAVMAVVFTPESDANGHLANDPDSLSAIKAAVRKRISIYYEPSRPSDPASSEPGR